jgi:MinD-like ATPase involved in chromosome partitioning or flagellar assembly
VEQVAPVSAVSEVQQVAPLLPQDLTEIQLPAQPPLSNRLRLVARAVLRPEAELRQPAAASEAVYPDRPINPEHLSHEQTPGTLARARQAWREGSYRWELERRIAAPRLRRCVTIAVISPKGGVGKTTVTALLGTLLSMVRHDRIVAIDANPDFGSLGRILTAHHDVYVDDLAEVLDDPQLTVTALDQNLGRTAHSLMVLPAPVDPGRMEGLDEAVYTRVMARLRQMVGIILLDCGTGLHDPASKAAIGAADQVLLVSDPDPATASLVVSAANLLHQRGLQIWLVVNKVPRQRGRLDLRVFGAHLSYARGLVRLPLEAAGVEALANGSFDWDLAPRRLRIGIAELATDLISAWPELGVC